MGFWDFVGRRKLKLEHTLSELDRELIEAVHFQVMVLYDELESFKPQLDESMRACERMTEILVNLRGEGKSGTKEVKGRGNRPPNDSDHPGKSEGKVRV